MLETFSSKAIVTKVKAMYGHRVTAADYEQLLHKTSVPACAAYLKNQTHYARVMRDVQETQIHRSALELLLGREMLELYVRLARYGGRQNQFYRNYHIAKLEINCIINCIRFMDAETQNEFIQSVPGYLPRFASFDVLALGDVGDYPALLHALEQTRYHKPLSALLKKEGEHVDIRAVEHALYEYYYTWVLALVDRQFSGSTKRELKTLFATLAELYNICAQYRLKCYFGAAPQDIERVTLDIKGRLRRHVVRDIIAAPGAEQMLQILSRTKYHAYFNNDQFSHIEYSAGRIRHDIARRYLTFSQNAATVFTSFMLLQELEIENLVNIIEGVRYGLDISQIRPLLVGEGA